MNTLQPGITVASGWCDVALAMFAGDRNLGSIAPCIVANRNRKTIQGINYHPRKGKQIVSSPRRRILAPLLGTGFYRASALRFMHGFDERYGVYADVELGLRMRSARYEVARCDSRIHSETRPELQACAWLPWRQTAWRASQTRARERNGFGP